MASINDLQDIPALTVRQPWASWIISGAKRFEIRSRRTAYRGPLLIHAGLFRGAASDTLPRGAIIGVVSVVDVVHVETISPIAQAGQHAMCDFSPGSFAWVRADPCAIETPIPCRGALGLWYPDRALIRATPACRYTRSGSF